MPVAFRLGHRGTEGSECVEDRIHRARPHLRFGIEKVVGITEQQRRREESSRGTRLPRIEPTRLGGKDAADPLHLDDRSLAVDGHLGPQRRGAGQHRLGVVGEQDAGES